MKHKKLLLGLLLLLGIGFALVSTTLLMTGNVKIATNNADFDVRFTKTVLDGTDISETAISADGKTITFETSNLTTVGDISKLDFEVANNSEMYDAVVSVACTAEGAKNSYYEITKEVASPIVGKTKESGNVQVKLLKATVEDFSETFTCTLTATAKERTSKAEPTPLPLKYTPKYFEFGDPTTASTQDYTTLTYPEGTSSAGQQAKVFVGLDAGGVQKSVCIVRNDNLECFKNNNAVEEQEHLIEAFSDITCNPASSYVFCNTSDFGFLVYYNGLVACYDTVTLLGCELKSDGSSHCGPIG